MKKIMFIILIVGYLPQGYAQVSLKINADGNVGIGTSTPAVPLVVERSQNAPTSMWVRNYSDGADASTSISSITQNQRVMLTANSDSYVRPYPGFHPGTTLLYSNALNGLNIISDNNLLNSTTTANTGAIRFITYNTAGGVTNVTSGNNELVRMMITGTGNVLIGKTTQTNSAYKLDINGNMRANDVQVNSTGADFVFEKEYKLRSLTDVEHFINENKHLPEISSAKTMQEEGMGVGELQTKLLQKIEELTLYLIQQNKEIGEMRSKIVRLERGIK